MRNTSYFTKKINLCKREREYSMLSNTFRLVLHWNFDHFLTEQHTRIVWVKWNVLNLFYLKKKTKIIFTKNYHWEHLGSLVKTWNTEIIFILLKKTQFKRGLEYWITLSDNIFNSVTHNFNYLLFQLFLFISIIREAAKNGYLSTKVW